MIGCPTHDVKIFCGLKEDVVVHTVAEAEAICQAYCDKIGLCVTVTPTTFIYTGGREPGIIVGFINYPRFPDHGYTIDSRAINLAEILRTAFRQHRVTVQTPSRTYMLGEQ